MNTTDTFFLGKWKVEPRLNRLECADSQVQLVPKNMLLLVTLCQQKQTPLSIDELMSIIWPGQVVSEASVYQAISQLRKALGDNSKHPEYIQRISNQGYRIIAQVSFAAPAPQSSTTNKFSKAYWLLPLILILILITSLAFMLLFPKHTDKVTLSEVEALTYSGLALNMDNESPQIQALSGIILTRLAQLPSIKVLQVPQTNRSQVTLQGNITRQGPKLRVSMQIVDNASQQLLWARLFDGNENNLFKLQDDISNSIYQAFDFQPDVTGKTTAKNTEKDFQQYLLARYHWQQRKPANLMRALDIYQKMPTPLTPLAATGLCEVYIYLNIYSDWSLNKVEQGCQPLLDNALSTEPKLGQALAAKALLSSRSIAYSQAKALFEEAITASPNYPFSYLWYAQLLRNQGYYQQALSLSLRAFELSPLSPIINRDLAYSYLNIREVPQAKYYYKRAIELEPDYPHKAITDLDFFPATPDRMQAFMAWQDRYPLMLERNQNYLLTAIQVYLNLGQMDKVKQSMARVNETRVSPAFMLYLKASIAVANNDIPQAIELLKLRLEQANNKTLFLYPYIAALFTSGQYQQVQPLIEKYYMQVEHMHINRANKYWLALIYQSKQHLNQLQSTKELSMMDTEFSGEKYDIDSLFWQYHRGHVQKTRKLAIELLNLGWLPDYNQDIFALHKLQQIVGNDKQLALLIQQNREALISTDNK